MLLTYLHLIYLNGVNQYLGQSTPNFIGAITLIDLSHHLLDSDTWGCAIISDARIMRTDVDLYSLARLISNFKQLNEQKMLFLKIMHSEAEHQLK